MRPNLGLLFLLSLGHLATDINQGALPIFLPFFKEAFDLSYTAAGAIILAANLSSSLIQPIFGLWSDKMENYWLVPAGCMLAGAGLACTGFVHSYWLLLAGVFLSGIGIAAYHPEASKVAHFAGHGYSARFMSIFSVGGNLGFALGPALAWFLWRWAGLQGTVGMLGPGLLVGLLLVLALPAIRWTVASGVPFPRRAEPGPAGPKMAGGYGPMVLVTLIVILRSFVHFGLTNYIPLYYVSYLQGDPEFASTLLTIFLLSGALGTLLGSPIADRWGAKTLVMISMAGLVPLTFLFLHAQGFWLILVVAASGFLVISTFATTVVLGQSLLPGNLGVASGIMMGFGIGAGGIGVTLLGSIADVWGVPVALQVIGFFPLIGLLLAFFLPSGSLAASTGGPVAREQDGAS